MRMMINITITDTYQLKQLILKKLKLLMNIDCKVKLAHEL